MQLEKPCAYAAQTFSTSEINHRVVGLLIQDGNDHQSLTDSKLIQDRPPT